MQDSGFSAKGFGSTGKENGNYKLTSVKEPWNQASFYNFYKTITEA